MSLLFTYYYYFYWLRAGRQGVEVRVAVGAKIFASPLCPDRLWGTSSLLSDAYRGPFTPREDSWYSFLLEAESTPGP
jgi:hypothetical protein